MVSLLLTLVGCHDRGNKSKALSKQYTFMVANGAHGLILDATSGEILVPKGEQAFVSEAFYDDSVFVGHVTDIRSGGRVGFVVIEISSGRLVEVGKPTELPAWAKAIYDRHDSSLSETSLIWEEWP